LAQDAYYKDASHLPLEQRRALNFDHPDSIEWDLMLSDIRKLKSGQAIECPTYSYITCTRLPETIHIEPKKILLSRAFLFSLNLKFAKKWTALVLEVEPDNACRALLNAIWKIAVVQLSRS
jgi:uridine kinase